MQTVNGDDEPIFLEPCGRNTAVKDIRCINTVFNEAIALNFRGAPLLDSNPNERYKKKLPKFGVRRARKPVTDTMYRVLLRLADRVDPTGRFRFFLVLVRWTGRRISTIRRFRRSTLLFTKEEIRAALETQLCHYVYEEDFDRVAKLYADAGGALYVEYWMEKAGKTGEEDRVEQYDAVIPVPPVVSREAERYLQRYWSKGTLNASDPLFPGGRSNSRPLTTNSVSEETINDWFNRALFEAAQDGEVIKLPPKNRWHGLRGNRRTEFRKVELKYARWLVGHSVRTGTPGITVSEGRYLGIVPEDLVEAVLIGTSSADEAREEV